MKRKTIIAGIIVFCAVATAAAFYVKKTITTQNEIRSEKIKRERHAKRRQTVASQKLATEKAAVQTALSSQLSALHFSGTALIIRHGKPFVTYTRGFANQALGIKNKANTMYEIDSMQKSLTAGILMNQVKQQRVQFGDTIGKFYSTATPNSQATVQSLLTMTAGITIRPIMTTNYVNDAQLINDNLARLNIDSKRVGSFYYSPLSYVLLAGISEKVSHQSYETLFKKQYIKKLGLKNTVMAYDVTNEKNIAHGYDDENYAHPDGANTNQEHSELGTGQVFMSAEDLYMAISSLIRDRTFGTLYKTGTNYGGGLYLNQNDYQANGAGYGFSGTIALTKDGENGVVILSNTQNVRRDEVIQTAAALVQKYCVSKDY